MADNFGLPPMTMHSPTPSELGAFAADNLFNDIMNDPTLAIEPNFEMGDIAVDPDFDADFDQTLFDAPRQAEEVVPMQPLMQMPVAQPQATPQFAPPDMSMGPSFHPMVGWYYPAQPTTPYVPHVPYALTSSGFTPASSIAPPASTMPSRIGTPVPGAKPKRKYGPAAYLEEQAKQRAAGNLAGRATSIEAQYTSKAKQRDERANGTTPTSKFRIKNAPIVTQVCICNDKEANKIKRPKNAFILYRSAMSKKIMKKNGSTNNQAVSKEAAVQWKNESEAVKQQYYDLAKLEAQRHAEMYPDYKYTPGITQRNKFGSESCQCGAYRANIQAMQDAGTIDADSGSEDEYVAPRRAAPAKQQQPAPPAPMTMPDPSTFGFSTPAQQAEADAYVAGLKRKRDAALEPVVTEEEPPLAKRRSPRNNTGNVSYTEPADDDIYALSPPQKRRPTPILTAQPTSPIALEDSPYKNTRSRSRASLSELFDFGFNAEPDWDNLFPANPELRPEAEADNDGDTIVVAKRRPSALAAQKKTSRTSPTRSSTKSSSSPKTYSLRGRS